MSDQEWYGVKVFHSATSPEVAERIEWCKENGIPVITRILKGIQFLTGETFTEEEMVNLGKAKIGIIEIDFSKMKPKEIGVAFFFSKDNAMRFKLVWGGNVP